MFAFVKHNNTTSQQMSTEDKIKLAAANVFIKKGYAATKTRDIAEEAGINIASLHYYYRSKEKLFEIVFGEALKQFNNALDGVFGSDLPLQEKIRIFAGEAIDFFGNSPHIPHFIISESQNNIELVNKFLSNEDALNKLKKELAALIASGEIRDVHPAHFIMHMVGLIIFPIISKPLLLKKAGIDSAQYDQLLEERKQIVVDTMISYFFINKSE